MKRESALKRWREIALELPDTDEGISCKGTVLESRTVKVDTRAFLFLGKDVRLKLDKSIASAKKVKGVEVGSGGWTTIRLEESSPDVDLVEKWIRESYALVAMGTAKKKKKTKKRKKKKR